MVARSERGGRAIEYVVSEERWIFSDTGETVPALPGAPAVEAEVSMEEVMMGCILFARIAKAIADVERVAQFEIVICDDDCKVHIRTTWGPVIDTTQPRVDWRHAVTKALDELEDIKPGTPAATDDKE